MQVALDLFDANIRRSQGLTDIFRAMDSQTTGALDLTDILRAALVMSVSALDHFIHEIVRLGMLEAYRAERVRTAAFLRFQVSLESIIEATSGLVPETRLESQIRERHGYQTFQTPDQIADAIRLISNATLWNNVSVNLDVERRELTETLTLIVQRRNKIAHEADLMPDYAGQTAFSDLRSPIEPGMVDDVINFIKQVGEAIFDLVNREIPSHRASGVLAR